MAEEQDGEITFSSTNSSKEQQNGEESLQNIFKVIWGTILKFEYILDSTKYKVLAAQTYPTLSTPWTVAHLAPLSLGFSWQEYQSGLPFPSPKISTQGLSLGLLHCRILTV